MTTYTYLRYMRDGTTKLITAVVRSRSKQVNQKKER